MEVEISLHTLMSSPFTHTHGYHKFSIKRMRNFDNTKSVNHEGLDDYMNLIPQLERSFHEEIPIRKDKIIDRKGVSECQW